MKPTFVHSKERRFFGRQCLFSDRHEIQTSIPADHGHFKANYVLQNPTFKSTQLTPQFAVSDCNTTRTEYSHRGMLHAEGGWPKDVNYLDEEQPGRYKRKIEKDDNYIKQVGEITLKAEKIILQNNAVNIYEEYFENLEGTTPPVESKMEQVQLFKDPGKIKRPIRHISWSTDDASKISTACASLSKDPNVPLSSYIWDIENPNAPISNLNPSSPILYLEFNPRDPLILTSGLSNGQVAIWDYRYPKDPVAISVQEISHQGRCTSTLWINSKSGREFFSGGSDGQVMWWDYRNLSEPIESLLMDPVKTDDQNLSRAQAVSVLEYETTIPTKFMVGTELGMLFSCNRKGKTPIEKTNYKLQCHFGPVWSLSRNPSYVKTFLTVGDWNARIWSEDNRDNPIFWTKNHTAALTCGAWSFGKCSLFYISRTDGQIDAWDILNQQDKPVQSLKVCDNRLEYIRMRPDSELLAVGNEAGKLFLVKVSSDMTQSAKKDKGLLTSLMDRESAREKILSDKMREIQLKLRNEGKLDTDQQESEGINLKQVEKELKKIEKASAKEFLDIKANEMARRRKEFLGIDDTDKEDDEPSSDDTEEEKQ